MIGGRYLLFWPDDADGPGRWLRIAEGGVVDGGYDVATASAPDAAEDERLILVAPGADVAVHTIELPDLAPAQALAAARLMAADVSVGAAERLHVALGEPCDGARLLAVVDAALIAGWLARAREIGRDPDHVLPEPLLLTAPETGWIGHEHGGSILLRGPGTALATEPEMVEAITGGAAVTMIDEASFQSGMAARLSPPEIDLRQGGYARRWRWSIDRATARRLAGLAAAILLTALLVQPALLLRYSIAADRIEHRADAVARSVLPGGGAGEAAPLAALARRLTGLRGGGIGFDATMAALFDAVRATPNVEIGALDYDRDGRVTVTLLSASAADLDAASRRIEMRGLKVSAGPVEMGGGRRINRLTLAPA